MTTLQYIEMSVIGRLTVGGSTTLIGSCLDNAEAVVTTDSMAEESSVDKASDLDSLLQQIAAVATQSNDLMSEMILTQRAGTATPVVS